MQLAARPGYSATDPAHKDRKADDESYQQCHSAQTEAKSTGPDSSVCPAQKQRYQAREQNGERKEEYKGERAQDYCCYIVSLHRSQALFVCSTFAACFKPFLVSTA